MAALNLTETEFEIVMLRATKELIDSFLNVQLLEVYGTDPDSEIRFHTFAHQRLFNIGLVDFLSATDKRAPVHRTTYLGALRAITDSPSFDHEETAESLRTATTAFVSWLENEVEISVWLPSIEVNTSLKLRRLSFLKMCGDLSKHNFLRSVSVAEELRRFLAKSGASVSVEETLLTLDDFYDRFHMDIFNYHGSTIAEFLNNIRWGIYDYLQPEFHRSLVWESRDPPVCRYTYPATVVTPFAKTCYWDLMNEMRTAPFMRKFKVSKWLKGRY